MRLAEGIRSRGFRKWYERELLRSHAYLLLAFLAAIGLLGAFEAIGQARSELAWWIDALAVAASAGIGGWALRRYLYLLLHAEAVARQAECARCGSYGRLALDGQGRDGGEVPVRCRGCGHAWTVAE